MNLSDKNRNSYSRWILLWLLMTVPVVTWADTKKSAPSTPAATHPATTAPHPAPSAPAASHSTTTQHPPTTQTHPATGGSQAGTKPGATTTGKPASNGGTATGKGSGPNQGAPGKSSTTTTTTSAAKGPTSTPPKRNDTPYHPTSTEQVKSLPNGGNVYHDAKTNRTVTTDSSGRVRTIDAPHGVAGNMRVTHYPGAGRVVVSGHPGARVVTWGPHHGYVERGIPGRHGYISRTYVYGGRRYAVVYREYAYHGVTYYRYVPAYYYGPRFYAWTATPWATPVPYYWGGMANPWVGYYSGYFAPYPVYASPDFWLTDYLIAENLKLAYQNQQLERGAASESAPASAPAPEALANANPTITPEFKAMIAEEVKQQLAAENAAAAQPANANSAQPSANTEQAPPALSQKVFVVSSSLDVTEGGHPCTLTPGDIIERRAKQPGADGSIAVEVVTSKKGDCAADSDALAQVQLTDLQEMHNQMLQQMDSGLKMLAENQAKGLPTAPAAGMRKVAEGTAEPAADAETTLMTQNSDAERLEAQVRQN